MRPISKQKIELARRLRSEGYQLEEIARRVGMTRTTVLKYCGDIDRPINHSHPKRKKLAVAGMFGCLDEGFDS